MKEILIKEYNNLIKKPIKFKLPKNTFSSSYIMGGKFEVLGKNKKNYNVKFIDQKDNTVIYESDITNNMWCKTGKEYFVDYKIQVIDKENNELVFEDFYNAENKKVYIHFASKAIGDTLAWFPYAEEFRKKHKCKLVVSTFHNKWFESTYPEIEFIKPATEIFDLYAMYEVGWHYNEDKEINHNRNPLDFRKIPLQGASYDILGLDNKEIKPKLSFKNTGPTIDGNYVCIAPHGSSHAKYWNRKGGWQDVIDYLNNEGYKVVMITQEPLGDEWHDSKLGGTLKGVIDKTGDAPLSERANDMMNAKAFIGIGSGLSWLAWGLGTPVVMISGFSEPYSEFEDCERVFTPEGNCNGCFNRVRLNAGDWEWCPEHRDTDRQFECHTNIAPERVFNEIKEWI